MRILGLDPGLKGAITLIDVEKSIFYTESLPFFELTKTKTKKFIDSNKLSLIIKSLGLINYSFMEQVGATPQMGVTSAFSFGEGYGKCQGVLAAFDVPLTLVPPQVWKKALSVPKDKQEAIARANQLIPGADLKKDGQAEASLIALYGMFSIGVNPKDRLRRVPSTEEISG